MGHGHRHDLWSAPGAALALPTSTTRDIPGTALSPAVPGTAPKCTGHHQSVLGARKLRHKDTSTVMSSASGNLRTFDSLCLKLARVSLAHKRKLPALSCWRTSIKGKDRKHAAGKTSWNLQNRERKRGLWHGRMFTQLLHHAYFTFYIFFVLHRFPWKFKCGITFKKLKYLTWRSKKQKHQALNFTPGYLRTISSHASIDVYGFWNFCSQTCIYYWEIPKTEHIYVILWKKNQEEGSGSVFILINVN